MAPSTASPPSFTRAVDELRAVTPRAEITLDEVPAPQRLAPYAYAISGTVLRHGEEVATGRLILLHDPAGHEAWDGTMRLVTYVPAELAAELAADPLLPAVGWSWLAGERGKARADHQVRRPRGVGEPEPDRLGDLPRPVLGVLEHLQRHRPPVPLVVGRVRRARPVPVGEAAQQVLPEAVGVGEPQRRADPRHHVVVPAGQVPPHERVQRWVAERPGRVDLQGVHVLAGQP